MTMVLSPSPLQRFFDDRGVPLAGGLLFTYAAGSNTKLTSYQNAAGGANSNPIVLNARGECDLWIPPNIAYDYVLAYANDTDPPSNPIWTKQSIVASQLTTLYGGVDIGVANAYVLNFTANFAAYQDGIVIYWIPANSNTGVSTINVNGIGVVPIVNGDGSGLVSGSIVSGIPSTIIYGSGKFVLAGNSVYSGTYTGTLTGGASAPTGTVRYTRSGSIVVMKIPTLGGVTSTSTSMTITGAPQIVWPSVQTGAIALPCLFNNGANVYTGAMVWVTTGGVVTFAINTNSPTTFTASGLKGVPFEMTFSYSV